MVQCITSRHKTSIKLSHSKSWNNIFYKLRNYHIIYILQLQVYDIYLHKSYSLKVFHYL